MELVVITALTLFAFGFGLLAALAQERNFLWPMAGIFLILSMMLLLSGTVEIQNGTQYSYKTVNNTTVKDTAQHTYTVLDNNYSSFDLSEVLAMLLLAISLYGFYEAAHHNNSILKIFGWK